MSEYKNKPLFEALFIYFMELYRKLNIKNTMIHVFLKIREIRSNIEANLFSINYARQSIDIKNEDLKIKMQSQTEHYSQGNRLNQKIEEAEIAHLRTRMISDNVLTYAFRIEKRLESINSRYTTLVGDCLLLATSVVYLGPYAPEEREKLRLEIFEYLTKVRNI